LIIHQNNQIKPLTGIRGIAAIWVILFHFSGIYCVFEPLEYMQPLYSKGSLGVDLFFILSGFIISYAYSVGQKKLLLTDYVYFLWHRLARLYPNHFATLVVLAAGVFLGGLFKIPITGTYPITTLPYQLTMTHVWPFIPFNLSPGWNYPSWSISAEWFAYLAVFPLCALILSKRIALHNLALSALFALIAYLVFANIFSLNTFIPLIQVTLEFLAGSLTYGCYLLMGDGVRGRVFRSIDWIVLVGLVFLIVTPGWGCKNLILIFPLIILGLTSGQSLTGRFLSIPLIVWLGEISYSLYMSHAITQKFLKHILPVERYCGEPLFLKAFVLIIYFVSIFIFALMLYYLIEKPLRKIVRRQ